MKNKDIRDSIVVFVVCFVLTWLVARWTWGQVPAMDSKRAATWEAFDSVYRRSNGVGRQSPPTYEAYYKLGSARCFAIVEGRRYPFDNRAKAREWAARQGLHLVFINLTRQVETKLRKDGSIPSPKE